MPFPPETPSAPSSPPTTLPPTPTRTPTTCISRLPSPEERQGKVYSVQDRAFLKKGGPPARQLDGLRIASPEGPLPLWISRIWNREGLFEFHRGLRRT